MPNTLEMKYTGLKVLRVAGPLLLALTQAYAQQLGQRTFATVDDAGQALFAAMKAPDGRGSLEIFGLAGKKLVASGDAAEDSDDRVGFVVRYEAAHRFVTAGDESVTLVVGTEEVPFPVHLRENNGRWFFDSVRDAGSVVSARIDKNQMAAIDACQALTEAQKQYFARPAGNLPPHFAAKMVSDDGRHNGLFFQATNNEFDSPLNPLIAYAEAGSESVPFNGYFFRILTSRGPHAPGGTKSYVVDGRMTSGFAFVAYPAQYGASGVMTFLVDESGAIRKKDLGPGTQRLAEGMTAYDPDSSWTKQ